MPMATGSQSREVSPPLSRSEMDCSEVRMKSTLPSGGLRSSRGFRAAAPWTWQVWGENMGGSWVPFKGHYFPWGENGQFP